METNTNSFWQRQEGSTAKGILVAIGLAFGFGLYKALPILIILAERTIYLTFLAGFIISAYLLLTSKWASTQLFLVLQAVSRAITSLWAETDPIGILKSFIKDMQNKAITVNDAVTKMRTARQKLQANLTQATKEMNDYLKRAEIATDSADIEKYTELAGRREEIIDNTQTNVKFSDDAVTAMTRVAKLIANHIELAIDQMEQLKNDNETALAMLAATSAANGVLGENGLTDLKNAAVDVVKDRVAKAKGEVESLMESTKSMQGEMDMTRMVHQADGKKKLDELRAKLNKAEAKQITAGPATPIVTQSGVTSNVNKWANIKKVN